MKIRTSVQKFYVNKHRNKNQTHELYKRLCSKSNKQVKLKKLLNLCLLNCYVEFTVFGDFFICYRIMNGSLPKVKTFES